MSAKIGLSSFAPNSGPELRPDFNFYLGPEAFSQVDFRIGA
jgi:hypothetical protein